MPEFWGATDLSRACPQPLLDESGALRTKAESTIIDVDPVTLT